MQAILASSWFAFLFAWIAPVVFLSAGVAAGVAYYRPLTDARRMRVYMSLAVGVIAFRLIFAAVKTVLQYYTWTLTDLSRFMLPPHQSIAVLFKYSWTNFWLNALVSIGAALLFFIVLRLLRSHNERYFETGEVELGFLLALVVGWPYFVIFVPVVFLLVVFISIIRGIFLHEPYTTLGLPFFLGALVAYGITGYIITTFDLMRLLI